MIDHNNLYQSDDYQDEHDNQVRGGEIRWKVQLPVVEDASNIIAREEGTHKTLLGIEKKPSKMDDDEWNDIDFHTKATIILCLSDEILYNVISEETTASLGSCLLYTSPSPRDS